MSRPTPVAPASPRVIVIGAGIAGLAAARTLLGSGVTEVLILEGRSRIGGRIQTDTIGPKNVPINIGAHFIHGCSETGCNLLLDFCKQHQITTVDFSELKELYFTGKEPAEQVTPEDMENAVQLAKEFDEALWKAERQGETLVKAVDAFPEKDTVGEETQELFMEMVRSKHAYAAPLSEMSVAGARDQLTRHHHRSVDQKSCGTRILPYGFSHVVQHLAQGISANILLDRPVSRIEQFSTYVSVTTSGATPETYFADAVIVTVPLGVLKSNAITFMPALSERKQQAIQKLGFGVQNRVYMTFDRVCWDDAAHSFHCVSDPRFQFFNMNRYGLGPMISVIVRPPHASVLDAQTDEQVIDEICKTLRTMFPGISKPTSFKISRWGTDPFARGSFSYVPSGASMNEVRDLSRPEGRIFFAGEATSDEEMQMARGAFTSALRVASEVIAHFRHPRVSTQPQASAASAPAHASAPSHSHAHTHHAPAPTAPQTHQLSAGQQPFPLTGAMPDPYQMQHMQSMYFAPHMMGMMPPPTCTMSTGHPHAYPSPAHAHAHAHAGLSHHAHMSTARPDQGHAHQGQQPPQGAMGMMPGPYAPPQGYHPLMYYMGVPPS